MSKWVEWIEPFGPDSEPVYCRVTVETAISCSKHNAYKAKKYTYEKDEHALDDFIAVHWGKIIEVED